MTLTVVRRRKPCESLTHWFDDMDAWFDYDFSPRSIEKGWLPPIDITEQEGTYVVKADLPGLKKEDIHVALHGGYLTLRGERKSEHGVKKGHYRRVERNYGTFERRLSVPEGLTEKDIKAHYSDGVLELTIPTPQVKKHRAIDVKIE
jgi:HSP20 family protein